jgi:hypothetical protein
VPFWIRVGSLPGTQGMDMVEHTKVGNTISGFVSGSHIPSIHFKSGQELMAYPAHYVLRVEEDIYQRVLAEISDSKQPCGIYFCGHHEDAYKPSIFIAISKILR